VSLGSGTMRATLGHLRRIADELKTTGTYSKLEDCSFARRDESDDGTQSALKFHMKSGKLS